MSPQLKTETARRLRLTPEQLEDLRTVLDNFGRHSITSDMTTAAERLADALFPATEPAEPVVPNPEHPYFVWEQGYQAAVTDSDAGVDGTRGNAYTSNPYSLGESEPDLAAEPAEEETKAEAGNWCILCRRTGHNHTAHKPQAPSPVAPAPNETGPWPSLKDIPAEVSEVRDVGKNLWRRKGGNWEWKTADGRWFEVFNPRAADDLAPFVAAEELDS